MARHVGHAEPARTFRHCLNVLFGSRQVPAVLGKIISCWPMNGRPRRAVRVSTTNFGSGTTRREDFVFVSSIRSNGCPATRTNLPVTASVAASASKSGQRAASNSDRRTPVPISTVIGSARSSRWHSSDPWTAASSSRSCSAASPGACFGGALAGATVTSRTGLASIAPAADPDTSATELAKVSAELRGLEKSVAEAIGRLSFDPDAPAASAQRLSRTRRAAAAQRQTFGSGRRGSA